MSIFIPLLSTVVAYAFAATVFVQFAQRRKTHQLVWGIALVIFGTATCMEFLGQAFGWQETIFKTWYYAGAVLGVTYLGTGTVYLLLPRRVAQVIAVLVLLGSLYALWQTIVAPVDMAAALAGTPVNTKGMADSVRSLTPFFNGYGTIALVGGAAYSAWLFWRQRQVPSRVVGNVLILVGALVVASGGTMTRFGRPEFLFLSELIGIVVIFLGFLVYNRALQALSAMPAAAGAQPRPSGQA